MDPPEFDGATDHDHPLYRGFRNYELARTDVSVARRSTTASLAVPH